MKTLVCAILGLFILASSSALTLAWITVFSSVLTAIQKLKQWSRMESALSYRHYVNLKRWNTEKAWSETLYRTILWNADGQQKSYSCELAPDSPLWIFPFPSNATGLNPNLTQNY